YTNRGIVLFHQGELKRAIADFDKAIEIDPGSGSAFLRRSIARYAGGDLKGAISDLRKAAEIDHGIKEICIECQTSPIPSGEQKEEPRPAEQGAIGQSSLIHAFSATNTGSRQGFPAPHRGNEEALIKCLKQAMESHKGAITLR